MPQRVETLPRRRCVIAAALALEIMLFSLVTFVIAYLSSSSAIHTASQRLADSMADTVAIRVRRDMQQTERSVQVLASTAATSGPRRSTQMLPRDTAEVPLTSSEHWSTEWIYEMRTLLMQRLPAVQTCVVYFADVSLAAVSVLPPCSQT